MKNNAGRILTVLLVAACLAAALWIFFSVPVQKSNNKTTTEQLLNCTCECRSE